MTIPRESRERIAQAVTEGEWIWCLELIASNWPVGQQNFFIRTLDILEKNGYYKLEVLLEATPEELLTLDEFGPTSLKALRRAFASFSRLDEARRQERIFQGDNRILILDNAV